MSLRLAIAQIDVTEINVAEFCRDHAISRDRFYTIRRRYQTEGDAGLAPRSRAPHTIANQTSPEVEDLIVTIRKKLTGNGLDAGAETIKWHLNHAGVDPPSVSTIWRILKRRGFIIDEPNKAPHKTWRRFVAEFVNELWQTDATHTELADGTEVDIVNIVDDHSRVCTRSHAVDGTTSGPDAWHAFIDAVAVYGIPARVLSDNGAPFTSNLFTGNLKDIQSTFGRCQSFCCPLFKMNRGPVHVCVKLVKERTARCRVFFVVYRAERPLDTPLGQQRFITWLRTVRNVIIAWQDKAEIVVVSGHKALQFAHLPAVFC